MYRKKSCNKTFITLVLESPFFVFDTVVKCKELQFNFQVEKSRSEAKQSFCRAFSKLLMQMSSFKQPKLICETSKFPKSVNKVHLDVCLQEVQSTRALDPHNKIHH